MTFGSVVREARKKQRAAIIKGRREGSKNRILGLRLYRVSIAEKHEALAPKRARALTTTATCLINQDLY